MYYYSVDIRGNYKKAAYIGHWISSIKIYSTLSEKKRYKSCHWGCTF